MILPYIYAISICTLILAIYFMSSPKRAHLGATIGIFGMLLAILSDFMPLPQHFIYLIIALICGATTGIIVGLKIKISSLPQMVAILNGLGGAAAVCIAAGNVHFFSPSLDFGSIIGAITFSGSVIAFCKLQGFSFSQNNIPHHTIINSILLFFVALSAVMFHYHTDPLYFSAMIILSLFLGIFIVLPIGGADMPIIISTLNACSGWTSVAIGFAQNNILLISVGTIVGIGGIVLSNIMIKAMNTSLIKLFLRPKINHNATDDQNKHAQSISPQDAAFIMQNSAKIIIVPGFGMAAASAQHALKNMADLLRNKYSVNVKYAIHPVAGRMPGHMNVLLAEANVSYDEVFELEDINHEFSETDVGYVIGANDITNPDARTNQSSPLYGMPILEVSKAKTVFFIKRSLKSGYSGVDNPLFFAPNTYMLYGDAKKVTEEIDKFLEQ